ncbi:MAG: HD domain-containing phosphohydrolase [Candidatus Omnitrophota bacterium]
MESELKGRIESVLRDIFSALQMAKLYPQWHPQFKKAIAKAYLSLQNVLSQKQELVIGIVGAELAFEKEIFFELSKTAAPMIRYFKEREIEKITFYRGVEEGDLSRFIGYLSSPKEEMKYSAQEAFSILGINNIEAGRIKVSAASSIKEGLKEAIDYLSTYQDCADKISGHLESLISEAGIDSVKLRLTVNDIMESLLERYQYFLNFATTKRHDLRTIFHILNVSILSMFFSSRLGFSKSQTIDIGTAALFHDIGKIYISRRIIQKHAKLTDEEFAKIKSHVIIGTEMLLKYADALGKLPAVVCFEHHIRYDLSGYPKVMAYQKPHIASLIVAICDIYDALSQRRGYKNDYPPEMIYNLMIREKGTTFEEGLIDKFFRVIGVWPVGTIVKLNDNSIAVVRETNDKEIFSPKVEVVFPQDKRGVIDLKDQACGVKIERSLNPLRDGKEYLPLVYPGINTG